MDDGRRSGVQEVKALQDLSAPAPQYFYLHHLEALEIPAHKEIRGDYTRSCGVQGVIEELPFL